MNNKYINSSRISEAKFRALVKYFSLELDAHRIASLVGLNRNTVNRYMRLFRERIAEYCEREFEVAP
jgi:transposase